MLLALSLASVVGHTLHYGLLAAGLVGVGALVLVSAPRPSPSSRTVGTVGHATGPTAAPPGAGPARPTAVAPTADAPAAAPPLPVAWPVAVVSSAAAAGVHAAMGPAHTAESGLLGALFAAAALAQLAWAGVVLLRAPTGPSARTLAGVGLVVHGAVLAAWALSRTAGLPGLEGPEAVGAWDGAAVLWQLVAASTCVWVLAVGGVRPLAPGGRWHRGAVAWAALSALALPLLLLAGALTDGGG